jgi:ABC-2 type transport system permease protein
MEGFVHLGPGPAVRPDGAAAHIAAVRAVAAAEFRMQLRRRSLWLVLGLLGAYMLWILPDLKTGAETPTQQAANWAWLLQVLMPIAFGVLLADRFPRDRKLRVDELLETSSAPLGVRLIGKYAGSTAATMVPIVATLAAGLVFMGVRSGDPAGVLIGGIPAFLLVNLPGLLFVAAFSVCCPLIMPVPVYQFLYVGYWFWGNLLPPQILPTLRDTWLAPLGWPAARGILGIMEDTPGPIPTAFDGAMSISLLLVLAVAALVAGWLVLRVEADRR